MVGVIGVGVNGNLELPGWLVVKGNDDEDEDWNGEEEEPVVAFLTEEDDDTYNDDDDDDASLIAEIASSASLSACSCDFLSLLMNAAAWSNSSIM
jgi:hypothetical protein